MISFKFHGETYQTERIIGHLTPDRAHRTIVFIGGIHGNEPTGVLAIQEAFRILKTLDVPINARLLGITGNLAALANSQRFIQTDLNRLWLHREIDAVKSAKSPEDLAHSEQKEQFELLKILQPILDSKQPVSVFDLHTTSAPSLPFIVLNDQIANRNLAVKFPVPTVIGIEEYLEGPLLSYVNEFGHVAMAYEAGRHDDWDSYENHLAFIMMSLVNSNIVKSKELPDFPKYCLRLENQCRINRGIYEVIYRERVGDEDQFVMNPGYQNFAPIKKDEQLARNRHGEIESRFHGNIFMPLYQPTGTDGYFIVKPVPQWALTLSTFLRKWNFEWFLTLLPGVSRSTAQPDTLIVNKNIARFLATELFHLLGYRRKKVDNNQLIFSRREIVH